MTNKGSYRSQWLRILVVCAMLVVAAGCGSRKPVSQAPKIVSRYRSLPPKEVPLFLKDSVLERCDLYNHQPAAISGYGLVANLRGTGDTTSSGPVRQHIRKEMINHLFGSSLAEGFERMDPSEILKDPRFAIVRVDALIPPGVRRHQRFDVLVTALEGNNTTSLAHGNLYRTDLKVNGANPQAPGFSVETWAAAEGSLFVNPAYALIGEPNEPQIRASLRRAKILNGGVAMMDRPIYLTLRQPQLSLARAIEIRIDQVFQNQSVASAKDEGMISVFVPERYGNDWEHFMQVVLHLYLDPSPDFAVNKARQLVDEALKPDAPLLDISYCWEGLGPTILPFIAPLLTNEKPEVAFAAARAAAYLGDNTAQTVLMNIARNSSHPFQITAVQTLATLPSSPVINQMLRTLLDVDQTLVRIEAYRALARAGDSSIISRTIAGGKFILDIVPSQGPPVVYAAHTGVPRIAVIGNNPKMDLPVTFMAMENKLSITNEPQRPLVNVFYRGVELDKPVSFLCPPDVYQLIARLGGEGAPGEPKLAFNYCDVVALIQSMVDQKRLSVQVGETRTPVAFVLQDAPQIEQTIEDAPGIPDVPMPAPQKLGSAAGGSGMNSAAVR